MIGENHTDGILVSSEGSNYARYSAFIPNARELIRNDIKQLVDFTVSVKVQKIPEDGKWAVTYEELSYHFDQAAISNENGFGKLCSVKNYSRENQ